VAVVGSARGIVSGVANIQGLAPELWTYLRRNYQRGQAYLSEGEAYLVATRFAGPQNQGPPVEARLPGASMEFTSGASGAVGPGVTVAQSFRVLDFDLSGVEFLFRSFGPFPCPISFVLTIYELGGPGGKRLLLQMPIQVSLEQRTKKVMFSFPPVAGTRGKNLLMEIAGSPAGTRPFSLLWNKATDQKPWFVDYYPAGQAYFNQRPLQADLYFVSY